ncbi:hypothetical protein M758_1G003200, partial [Ceratodon purpureus]
MRLNLLSFNARGLNDPAATDSLQFYLKACQPAPDIVYIQEHKRRGIALSSLGPALWRHALSFGLDASPGYGNQDHEDGAGCGGVLTLLAPRWSHAVTASGSILDNRVQWVILSGLPGGDLGIANVYAHNTPQERCHLWEAMTRDLPAQCRWLLLGDFNMVEAR